MKLLQCFTLLFFGLTLYAQETDEELNREHPIMEGVWKVVYGERSGGGNLIYLATDTPASTYYCFGEFLNELSIYSFYNDSSSLFTVEHIESVQCWDDSLFDNYVHPTHIEYWGLLSSCIYEGYVCRWEITYSSESDLIFTERWYDYDSVEFTTRLHLRKIRNRYIEQPADISGFFGSWKTIAWRNYLKHDSITALPPDRNICISLDSARLILSETSVTPLKDSITRSNILSYRTLDFLGKTILIAELNNGLYLNFQKTSSGDLCVSFVSVDCNYTGTYLFSRRGN